MAVSTIKKRMEVQKLVVDTTTDVMGDIALYSLPHASNLIIGADPDRNAGSGYYTSWYSILPNGRTGASYSVKIVNDSMQNLTNTKVKFTVYYISI